MKFLSLFLGGDSGDSGTGLQNRSVSLSPPARSEVVTVVPQPIGQEDFVTTVTTCQKRVVTEKALLIQEVHHRHHCHHLENTAGEAKCQTDEVVAAPAALVENVLPETATEASILGTKPLVTYWHGKGMPPAAKQAVAYWRSLCPDYWRGCFTCPDAELLRPKRHPEEMTSLNSQFCKRYPMPEVAE